MSTFKPTTADINNVASVKGNGWNALRVAATILDRIGAGSVTLTKYVAAANNALGEDNPKAGYSRVAQLTKLATELRANGIEPLDVPVSAHTNGIATILDSANLGRWHRSKSFKGIPAVDAIPGAMSVLSANVTNGPATMHAELVAYRDSLAPSESHKSADMATSPKSAESADSAADDANSAAADILDKLNRATIGLKSATLTDSERAEIKRAIVQLARAAGLA